MKCPCHSGLDYINCCKPYHEGGVIPTPLALMRSRYSAYAMNNVEYIIATTHPNNPEKIDSEEIALFCKSTQFEDLEILEFNTPYVTFRATLSQQGRDCSFTEKSKFAKIKGRWLYLERQG